MWRRKNKMSFFEFNDEIKKLSDKALLKCRERFEEIDKLTEFNQQRVLKAFIDNGVCESHFVSSTGYGYGDRGREVLDELTATIFGTEDAIIRHSFASGTHTLAVMLFGVLRPGDNVLCVTGTPYDTIHSVIGLTGEGMGSLKDFGVTFDIVELLPDGTPDYEGIEKALKVKEYKAAYIQRSRGYSLRPSLLHSDLQRIVKVVKNNSDARIIRDGVVIYEGKLGSLKRFQDDAKEVSQGYECGITIERFNDIKEGDIIEGFVSEEVKD